MSRAKSGETVCVISRLPVLMGWGLLLCAALAVSGCANRKNQVLYDGEVFRAKASKIDRDTRQMFAVEVPGVSKSFEGAREAGRFEGTRYCLENYGTSDIVWSRGPDDDPDTLLAERDKLSLRGTCVF